MKYEKQRHQGEENSSKPKRGDQRFQLTHTWLLGEEAQEGAPGVGPMVRAPRPSHSRDGPTRAPGSSAHGKQLLIMPSFIRSCLHSFHSPTTCPAKIRRPSVLSATVTVPPWKC